MDDSAWCEDFGTAGFGYGATAQQQVDDPYGYGPPLLGVGEDPTDDPYAAASADVTEVAVNNEDVVVTDNDDPYAVAATDTTSCLETLDDGVREEEDGLGLDRNGGAVEQCAADQSEQQESEGATAALSSSWFEEQHRAGPPFRNLTLDKRGITGKGWGSPRGAMPHLNTASSRITSAEVELPSRTAYSLVDDEHVTVNVVLCDKKVPGAGTMEFYKTRAYQNESSFLSFLSSSSSSSAGDSGLGGRKGGKLGGGSKGGKFGSGDFQSLHDLDNREISNCLGKVQFEFDVVEDKPWRMATSTVSDYFNFELNERTFREYLQAQIKLRFERRQKSTLGGII
jgi:hypothetical protein